VTAYRVTSPVETYTGDVGEMHFDKGRYQGEVTEAARHYFETMGYKVEDLAEALRADLEQAKAEGKAATDPVATAQAQADAAQAKADAEAAEAAKADARANAATQFNLPKGNASRADWEKAGTNLGVDAEAMAGATTKADLAELVTDAAVTKAGVTA
jgi:hypothetical protein